MDRRAFIGSLALGTLARPRVARAQPARKVARIGILSAAETSDLIGPQPRSPGVNALLRGLGDLGYVYGQNFVTEARSVKGGPGRYPVAAAELVHLGVDVIVAGGPPLLALKQATTTIPVVMAAAGDPVRLGFVRSLGRPGGNFTGLSLQHSELAGKRLQLLVELVPSASRVAVLWHRFSAFQWEETEVAARALGRALRSLEIREASDIERAFTAATDWPADALLVIPGAVIDTESAQIANRAARSRLPAMYGFRFFVDAGGLISYSADINEIWRRAAVFVDKILKGAKPADLPVEQPTKFELVLNMRAAKALGLTIPPSLLLRVDEVIQ